MRGPAAAVIRNLRAGLALGLLALTLAACAAQPPVAGSGTAAATAPQAPRVDPARPAQVALLAPFSGGESGVQAQARDLEAAARMALDGFPAGLVDLRVYDTAADPARAVTVAEQAVSEGATLILGPFFAAEALAVSPVAQRLGVQALAFTPFSGAASASTVVLGFAPENEVERVLQYAVSQGKRNFAVVYPQEQYGEIVAQAAASAAPRAGGRLVSRLSYPRSQQGVQDATASGARGIIDGGTDAVLIAEGGGGLEYLASFLAYHDVLPSRFQYLGTSTWESLRPSAASTTVGGWFAARDPDRNGAFVQRFRARAGRAPVGVAALGYDAAVVAATLAQQGRAANDPTPFTRQRLQAAADFPGAAGPFRIGSDGVVRRALAVMEVTADGFVIRDPAPAVLAPAS